MVLVTSIDNRSDERNRYSTDNDAFANFYHRYIAFFCGLNLTNICSKFVTLPIVGAFNILILQRSENLRCILVRSVLRWYVICHVYCHVRHCQINCYMLFLVTKVLDKHASNTWIGKDTRVKSTKTLNTLSWTRLNLVKFEIFAGPSLKISGGYYEISGGLSFTRAIAQTALLRVVTPRIHWHS